MKQTIKFLSLFAFLGLFAFASCSDDDDNETGVLVNAMKVEGLTSDAITLEVGKEFAIKVILLPENAKDKASYVDNEYTSSNEEVAKIVEGRVKAVGAGEATISVVAANNKAVKTSFKVVAAEKIINVESVEVTNKDVTMATGDSKDLSAEVVVKPENATNKAVRYASADAEIATVNDKGVVTAIKPGTVNINVTSVENEELKTFFTVKIVAKVETIEVENKALEIEEGKTAEIGKVTVGPESAPDKSVTYASADEKIAKVDAKGLVTAVAPGTVKITVASKTAPEVKAEVTVTVKAKTSVEFDRSTWTVETSVTYTVKEVTTNYVPDGKTGKPEDIIDNDAKTFLSLVKPKKAYGDYKAADYQKDESIPLFFVIDMKEVKKFDYIEWVHRTGNSNSYLRAWGIDVYGSTTGEANSFKLIKDKIVLDYEKDVSENIVDLPESEYKFIKIVYSNWSDIGGGSTSGGSLQVGEVKVGKK